MARESLIEHVRGSSHEDILVAAGEGVVVGVSGGVDSVTLLHLLKGVGAVCRVVHVNYGLRGAESDGDADFVVRLCEHLALSCTVVQPPEGWSTRASGESLQELARNFRYQVFEDVAHEAGIAKVAVAHHLSDQVETILMRLVRGTGLRGLAGMRRRRPISENSSVELVRPLLFMARSEILQWASEHDIDYREDRSNNDARFDRTRMRNQVIPSIAEAFGESGLRNIARSAGQAQAVFDAVVAERLDSDLTASTRCEKPPTLMIDALMKHEPGWRTAILLEAVRRWIPHAPERATIANQIETLLTAQPGKRLVIADTVIWRGRGAIVFVGNRARPDCLPGEGPTLSGRRPAVGVPGYQVSGDPVSTELLLGRPVDIGHGVLLVEEATLVEEGAPSPMMFDRDPNTELADDRVLLAPMSVGRWRPGDRFQPLGMAGRKNVSDFLTDQKLEPHLKSEVPVVKSGGEIVWIVGHRLAHPFRVRSDSKKVVRLSFIPRECP